MVLDRKKRYGTGKINRTACCVQFSKAVRYETSTMMDDELMFFAQWWMCNGISTMVLMLNGIFTYIYIYIYIYIVFSVWWTHFTIMF